MEFHIPGFQNDGVEPSAPESPTFRATRLVVVQAGERDSEEEAPSETTDAPLEVAEPARETARAPSTGTSVREPEVAEELRSSRLRPRLTNPVLWRPLITPAHPADAARARLFSELDEINGRSPWRAPPDSEAFGTWTAGTGDTRWGASAGALHLGRFSVRLCRGADASDCGFGAAVGRRGAYKAQMLLRQGLSTQWAAGELSDRAEAIRDRRNVQRDTVPDTF